MAPRCLLLIVSNLFFFVLSVTWNFFDFLYRLLLRLPCRPAEVVLILLVVFILFSVHASCRCINIVIVGGSHFTVGSLSASAKY